MPRPKAFDEEEILQKAMLLFWKKGYHDTSIKDLIDFLGISNASIYNTFGGKKQLFNRAVACYRSTNHNGLKNFMTTQKDVRKGLIKIFQKIVTDDQNDQDCKGCFIVNTTTELLPADATLQKALSAHKAEMEKLFYDFLKMGVQTGQISKDKNIKTLSKVLYTLMTGLRVLSKTNPQPKELMTSVKTVLSLLD